jgi:hypothetical protein
VHSICISVFYSDNEKREEALRATSFKVNRELKRKKNVEEKFIQKPAGHMVEVEFSKTFQN